MHFEILIEDQSGKKMLEHLLPKLIGKEHTHRIHAYKGVGRIPKNNRSNDPAKRVLLNRLPELLRGYGKTYDADYPIALFIVCDLDDKCLASFRRELSELGEKNAPHLATRYCIAIEEGEAWFLGDRQALKAAYPKAKTQILDTYVQDSICGTWERLADVVYPGGSKALKAENKEKNWQVVGAQKSKWAETITPHMDVEANLSPSFAYFKRKVTELM